MRITVRYSAQVKAAAKTASQVIEVPEPATVEVVIRQAAAEGSESLSQMLIANNGTLQPTLLLFVGEDCVSDPNQHELIEGDTVVIMSPISGG